MHIALQCIPSQIRFIMAPRLCLCPALQSLTKLQLLMKSCGMSPNCQGLRLHVSFFAVVAEFPRLISCQNAD